jgi:hypothetical protein
MTLSTSPISAIVAQASNKISNMLPDVHLGLISNERGALTKAHLKCILIGDAPGHASQITL